MGSWEGDMREESLRFFSLPERAAFIRAAANDDPLLSVRVPAWLESEQAVPCPRAIDPLGDGNEAAELDEKFKVLLKLGEGGFGAVFLAQQLPPIQRLVAVKVLKSGMDTRQIVARFEAERQALALMDHPNIAKIFDAGATGTGRPYFTMEFVSGTRITAFVSEHRLSTLARLALFIQVCQAVQHAHQKGIIHRDIKPSNVMVALHDGVPVPKVIDFGIAKAIQQNLAGKTVITQFQQLLGTPAYISPEQALVTSNDIDTRSDVYSLGALLYELLVDRPPFDHKELLASGIDEMRRTIREKVPIRPSRVLRMRQNTPNTPFTTLSFPTDLDWIVMKSLEKDRNRRYQTANGLAMDIQRYLDHEPIVARPPSFRYRIAKMVRRNPLVTALVTLLTIAVTVALVVVVAQNMRTNRAKREIAKTVIFLQSEKMEKLCAEGWQSEPIAWLSRRLRTDPMDQAAASRLISMFMLHNFALPVCKPLQHQATVLSAEFSPDGTEMMTASGNGMVHFWDAHSGRALRSMSTTVGIASAAYRAGGKRLLITGNDGVARIFDSGSKLVFEVPGVRNPAEASAEGGGGRWLMVEHDNSTISRWDLQTGAALGPLITLPGGIGRRDYSDAGSCFAVAQADTVQILDEVSGRPVVPPRAFRERISRLCFAPDGRHLLVFCPQAQRLMVWNFRGDESISEFSFSELSGMSEALFSADSRRLLTSGWDRPAWIWDYATKKVIGKPVSVGVNPIYVMSRSGRIGAAFGQSGQSLLFDLDDASTLMAALPHEGKVVAASLSADATRLLTGSIDGTARLWDIQMRKPILPSFPKPAIGGLAFFNHAGNRVVVTVDTDAIQAYDANSMEPVSPILRHDLSERFDIRDAQFSPDDARLLTVSSQGLLRIWDAKSFQPCMDIQTGGNLLNAKISPDGRFIVAGDRDGVASIWDVKSGLRIANALHGRNEVLNLDIHPNGSFFVTAALDGLARVWTLPEGKPAMPPLRHHGILWSAIYSPNGERIVTASSDRTAQIWDSRTGQPLHKAMRHAKDVYHAVFSPDGRRVLTTSEDGTSRVWNSDNGEPVSPFFQQKDAIWFGAFSPDGRTVATGSNALEVWLWDPDTGLPVSEPLRVGNRLEFSPDGKCIIIFGDQARLHAVVRPPVPVPSWLCDLAEGVGGYRQSEDGQLQPTESEVFKAIRDRVAVEPAPDFYSRWARWFLIDRLQPTIQPFKENLGKNRNK